MDTSGVTHIDIVRAIERLHRRSLDLIRADLIQAGVDDLSPSQVMMLFTIGPGELSVRDLIERGYYLGSNASYSLKRLVEADYIIRTASERDRRSARIRLSGKGRQLCDLIRPGGTRIEAHRLVGICDGLFRLADKIVGHGQCEQNAAWD